MEWVVLAFFAALAAAFIGLPQGADAPTVAAGDEPRERRERLLQELHDLDADAREGRISPEDRVEGRRALAPALRAVTQELRDRGESVASVASSGGRS